MGNYESSTTVRMSPSELFEYLSDVENLPAYLPSLTSARRIGSDKVAVTAHIDPPGGPEQDVRGEAWIKVKQAGRTLEWGAPGPNDYHGELDVDPGPDAGRSKLTVRVHTVRVEGQELQDGVDDAVQAIARAVEATSD
jgi:hypothetical protein